jgi:hypothetical protein
MESAEGLACSSDRRNEISPAQRQGSAADLDRGRASRTAPPVEVAENPQKLGLPPTWHKTEWGKAVASAKRAALELACPYDTPRQMRVYAFGLQALFGKRAAQEAANSEQEVEA